MLNWGNKTSGRPIGTFARKPPMVERAGKLFGFAKVSTWEEAEALVGKAAEGRVYDPVTETHVEKIFVFIEVDSETDDNLFCLRVEPLGPLVKGLDLFVNFEESG